VSRVDDVGPEPVALDLAHERDASQRFCPVGQLHRQTLPTVAVVDLLDGHRAIRVDQRRAGGDTRIDVGGVGQLDQLDVRGRGGERAHGRLVEALLPIHARGLRRVRHQQTAWVGARGIRVGVEIVRGQCLLRELNVIAEDRREHRLQRLCHRELSTGPVGVVSCPLRHRRPVEVEDHEEGATRHVDRQQGLEPRALLLGGRVSQPNEEHDHRNHAREEPHHGGAHWTVGQHADVGEVTDDAAEEQGRHENLGHHRAESGVVLADLRLTIGFLEGLPAQQQDHRGDAQTKRGHAERPQPSGLIAYGRRQERRHERADVDPHVEDVEARVSLGVAGGVQVSDHHRDVRLEEAVPDDQAHEARHEVGLPGNAHQEQARRHEHRADEHGLAVAKVAVGEHPAGKRREVDERQVQSVDLVAFGRRQSQAAALEVRGVEQQDVQHRVERQAFPHLGEEQPVQAFGVSARRHVEADYQTTRDDANAPTHREAVGRASPLGGRRNRSSATLASISCGMAVAEHGQDRPQDRPRDRPQDRRMGARSSRAVVKVSGVR
jgi:hypothetical protein